MAITSCSYGDTKTGKTADIAGFARLVYERTGKPTRVIITDSGGWEPLRGYIDAGMIEVLSLVHRQVVTSDIRKLSRGEWPKDSSKDKWEWQTDYSSVGGLVLDSIAGLAERAMTAQVQAGRKIAEDIVGGFTEEGEKFGNPARAHYGFVQKLILDTVISISGLKVYRAHFTSLEAKGEDDMNKRPVYGPASIGKALTDSLPTKFGDLLHYDIGEDSKTKKPVYRGWFIPHPDKVTNINFPAGPRIPKSQITKLMEKFPEGYFIRGLDDETGLYEYLKLVEELYVSPTDEIKAFMARVKQEKEGGGSSK